MSTICCSCGLVTSSKTCPRCRESVIDIAKLYTLYEQKRTEVAQKRDEIGALRHENKALRRDNENLLARTDEFASIIVSLAQKASLTPDEEVTIDALLHEAE